MNDLETAIEESISSHHERLYNKKNDDLKRRKEIKQSNIPSRKLGHLKTVNRASDYGPVILEYPSLLWHATHHEVGA